MIISLINREMLFRQKLCHKSKRKIRKEITKKKSKKENEK